MSGCEGRCSALSCARRAVSSHTRTRQVNRGRGASTPRLEWDAGSEGTPRFVRVRRSIYIGQKLEGVCCKVSPGCGPTLGVLRVGCFQVQCCGFHTRIRRSLPPGVNTSIDNDGQYSVETLGKTLLRIEHSRIERCLAIAVNSHTFPGSSRILFSRVSHSAPTMLPCSSNLWPRTHAPNENARPNPWCGSDEDTKCNTTPFEH